MRTKYAIEQFGALFDAHIHTYFDYHDGMISPIQLIKCAIKKNFNYVCAMSHDTTLGKNKIKKLAREYDLPCVSAIEVSTIHNHILAYGVQDWPYRRDTLEPDVAIEYLRDQDCAIFLAHPYSKPYVGLWTPDLIKRLDIDGIEWTNGTIYYQNRKTHKIYHHFPIGRRIAGSDAHTTAVFGSSFTQVDVNSEDPDDLVASMKKGKCKAYSFGAPIHRALKMALKAIIWNKIIKRRLIEGRYVIPDGDHPGSIVPQEINTSAEWIKTLLKRPEIEMNKKWIEGLGR